MSTARHLRKRLNVIVPKERVIGRSKGCWNCVAGDSLILTKTKPLRIEDAIDLTHTLSRNGWSPAQDLVLSGEQEVVEVLTTYGTRLRVTPDHRIFTDRGWVAAGELRSSKGSGRSNDYAAGDEVPTMPEVILSYTNAVEVMEAELLGAITGDGWVNPTKGVGFGFASDRIDAWQPLLAYAGERFASREQPHIKNRKLNNFYQLEWRTRAAKEWAGTLDKKHVPDSIWRSAPTVMGAYLRGLFTTDGTLGHPRLSASFYQVTKTLIDETQLLLRLLGIHSHVRVERRLAPHQDLYSLTIGREKSLRRFEELVNFSDQRRRELLHEGLSTLKGRDAPERVIDVKPAGRAVVYDISVPGEESFFANGLLVHNCKGWDREKAKPLWTEKRQNDLKTALDLAMNLPDGEPKSADECKTPDALRCFNIKSMVNSLDHLVASGHVGVCMSGGRTEDGNPVGDFVVHSFLCDRWSGMSGANLAKDGTTNDTLPSELAEQMKKLPS